LVDEFGVRDGATSGKEEDDTEEHNAADGD